MLPSAAVRIGILALYFQWPADPLPSLRRAAKVRGRRPLPNGAGGGVHGHAARLHGQPGFRGPRAAALHAAGHDIAAVYYQPPRPAGRGHAVRRCAVQAAAERSGCRCARPRGCAAIAAEQAAFAALGLDAAVVAAYGLILPQAMLDGAARAAASTSTPACCRAGAARRRSRPPSWPATPRPASPSCGWTRGSIPARCCCAEAVPITPATPPRRTARRAGRCSARG